MRGSKIQRSTVFLVAKMMQKIQDCNRIVIISR